MNIEKVLQDVFGFENFRAHQREIIEAIVNDRKDVCCVMPTGHGKSICYQLPPFLIQKPAIIISPLLSLMEDQRLNLESKGIKACCYNSTITNKTQINSDILDGHYTHIYITPETALTAESLLKSLEARYGLSLIAIDESHCVSLWGSTFRSSYLKLSIFKTWFPNVPMLALTGTATSKVEEDIVKLLKLSHPLRIRTSANRKNLSYYVHSKTDPISDLQPHITNSCIIYCQTRKDTEYIADLLMSVNVKCRAYHAGLSDSIRKDIHHEFLSNTITCIVATICFGMGIDKPDIRQVIHYGCPKDIESYCQETGRAGRDGQPGECHIYFTQTDFEINRYFLKDITDDRLRQYKEEMTRQMEKYLYTTTCRRKYLLAYFGESLTDNSEICCDMCLNPAKSSTYNIGPHIQALLELCSTHTSKFGKVMYIKVLRGENTKKMPVEFKSSRFFGCGKSLSVDWWKMCIQHCVNSDLIRSQSVKSGFGSIISVTSQGCLWLIQCGQSPEFLVDPNSMLNTSTKKKTGKTYKPRRKVTSKKSNF